MNRNAYMAGNYKCHVKTEGLLTVTCGLVRLVIYWKHCKREMLLLQST